MKRRLILARALINDPDLLVFDEPTTGLDPQARHMIWSLIHRLKRNGKTILITTHYMEEAEVLADRFALMNDGLIGKIGTMDELQNSRNSTIQFEFDKSLGILPKKILNTFKATSQSNDIEKKSIEHSIAINAAMALYLCEYNIKFSECYDIAKEILK